MAYEFYKNVGGGEATFGGDEFQRPTDYLRESPDSIEQAWVDAVMKEAASTLGDGKPFMRDCELRDDAVGYSSHEHRRHEGFVGGAEGS